MSFLSSGTPVTPEEILDAREHRSEQLCTLALAYPLRTLISFKLNIPGPVKAHPILDAVFDQAVVKITEKLDEFEIHAQIREATGPELILSSPFPAEPIKAAMIELEESSPLGRLFDIDVQTGGRAVSRSDLGLNERTCLICKDSARICGRSGAHELSELLEAVELLIANDTELSASLAKRS